jgi:hypothetical protein
MEESPSGEADSRSANQEILSFLQSEGSLLCSKDHATGLYPQPD